MTELEQLRKLDQGFHPLVLPGDSQQVGSAVLDWADAGLTVRVVRGRKMRCQDGVFDEFAAALQFPLYFGENKNAFDECLSELEHLPFGEGFAVVITEPDQVLADEPGTSFDWLARAFNGAFETWSNPIELGEWWDRPAVPFHVVLAGPADVVALGSQRWSASGIGPLPLIEN